MAGGVAMLEAIPGALGADDEGASTLVVDQFGAYLGKHSERVRVTVKGEMVVERPLYGLDQVLILCGGVSLSSDLVRACAEEGVQISFVSRSGDPYARLVGPGLTGTIKTRREQLLAYGDGRGVAVAKAFAQGKLNNQANLLRYMTKNRRDEPELYDQVHEAAYQIQDYVRRLGELGAGTVDELRQELMTLEAHAAKWYWDAARRLLVREVPWTGRETRGATDLVNSCLNYGYGILYGQVERAVLLAGLDPYAGFVHADRAGKPSLVLDAVEEFRQPVVDRTVFGLLNRGSKLEVDEGRLSDATRRLLAERVLGRLAGLEPYAGKRYSLGAIVQAQSRRLAGFLRGDGKPYAAYVSRW